MAIRNDKNIEVWDFRTAEIIAKYSGKHAIEKLAFTNRGSTLLLLEDGCVKGLNIGDSESLIVAYTFSSDHKFTDIR